MGYIAFLITESNIWVDCLFLYNSIFYLYTSIFQIIFPQRMSINGLKLIHMHTHTHALGKITAPESPLGKPGCSVAHRNVLKIYKIL